MNKYLSTAIPKWYPNGFDFAAIGLEAYTVDVATSAAIWAVEIALVVGIIASLLFDCKRVTKSFKKD